MYIVLLIFQVDCLHFSDEDCEYIDGGAGLVFNRSYYFDDVCFDGQKESIKFGVNTWKTKGVEGEVGFLLQLHTFDESAYDYLTFLSNYNNDRGTAGLNKLPIRVPSSFENAYGVFGAYNYEEVVLALQ